MKKKSDSLGIVHSLLVVGMIAVLPIIGTAIGGMFIGIGLAVAEGLLLSTIKGD